MTFQRLLCSLLTGAFLTFFLMSCSSPAAINSPIPYLTRTGQTGLYGVAAGAAIGGYAGGGVGGAAVGALAGGIIGTTLGHFLQQNQTLIQRINDQGVQVITVGDNLMFILPSDKFFYPDSPHRIHTSDAVLMDIAHLIASQEKITVKIAGYTDTACSADRAQALTQQQAQAIGDYVWAIGADTRILYAEGYGSRHPIASNDTADGRAMNRRLQISLRLLPTCCVLATGTGGE